MAFKYVRVCDQCGVVLNDYERTTIDNNDYCKECASYRHPIRNNDSLSYYDLNKKNGNESSELQVIKVRL